MLATLAVIQLEMWRIGASQAECQGFESPHPLSGSLSGVLSRCEGVMPPGLGQDLAAFFYSADAPPRHIRKLVRNGIEGTSIEDGHQARPLPTISLMCGCGFLLHRFCNIVARFLFLRKQTSGPERALQYVHSDFGPSRPVHCLTRCWFQVHVLPGEL
jgi:hypothetical protein